MKGLYRTFFTLFSCCFLLSACLGSNISTSLHGEMATPYHITADAQVNVSPIRVYVHPNVSPNEALRGLFVPLRVTQDIASPRNVSHNMSRQLWQVWLAQAAFEALEYDDRLIPYQVSDALALAKQRGANVLVGGYITHFLDSGSVGDSAVSMQIEVYEVETGALLWSMGQAGTMDKQQAIDLYVVGIQERMPADPAGLIARSLAYDMGIKVKDWAKPSHDRKDGDYGQVF